VDAGFGYPYFTRLRVQTMPKCRLMSLALFLSLNNFPSHFTHPLFLRDHALVRLFPLNSLVPFVIATGVPEDKICLFHIYAIDIIYDSRFFKAACPKVIHRGRNLGVTIGYTLAGYGRREYK